MYLVEILSWQVTSDEDIENLHAWHLGPIRITTAARCCHSEQSEESRFER